MAEPGYAIAAFREAGQWRCEPLPPAVLEDLGILLRAVRSQPSEGGPFVVACINDDFFLVARQDGAHIALMLSDLTAAVEYPLAEQVLDKLGEDPPEDDELDEVWPIGDLDIFEDLGLPEDEFEDMVADIDASADEMLDDLVDRIGLAEAWERAHSVLRTARVGH